MNTPYYMLTGFKNDEYKNMEMSRALGRVCYHGLIDCVYILMDYNLNDITKLVNEGSLGGSLEVVLKGLEYIDMSRISNVAAWSLSCACYNENIYIARIMFALGKNAINVKQLNICFRCAMSAKHKYILKTLIERGANDWDCMTREATHWMLNNVNPIYVKLIENEFVEKYTHYRNQRIQRVEQIINTLKIDFYDLNITNIITSYIPY